MKTLKETQKLISDIQGILNAVCNDMMSVTSGNFPHRFASIRGCIHNCSEMFNDAINENILYNSGYDDGVKETEKVLSSAVLEAFRDVLSDDDGNVKQNITLSQAEADFKKKLKELF